VLFDDAIFNTRLRGNYSLVRTNSNFYGTTNMLGLQAGQYYYDTSITRFVPGAMADNLTSYGGLLFQDSSGMTTIPFLLGVGAAGSYGTVTEPCNYLEKFPSPQNYFYQARGFSLAECYYMSVTNPYEGLMVGEPLAAPFAQPASGAWMNLPANSVLGGTTNLSVQFTASDTNHPVQQVDLFVDGLLAKTVTNIPPWTNNVLSVTLNGNRTSYTVPAGATIKSVVSNLTVQLNQSAFTNLTKVSAYAHGDRVDLKSFDFSKSGSQVSVVASNALGTGSALSTSIASSGPNFLDTIAFGIRSYAVTNEPTVSGNFLQLVITKTNGNQVTFKATYPGDGTNVTLLTQSLVNMVNTNASLQGDDGLAAEDFVGYDPSIPITFFDLRALSPGWNAAQIQAAFSASAPFQIGPSGTRHLDENLSDLEPRAHLYVTAGVTNLLSTFPLNTSSLADGFHELTAVGYEGSHVRTQKRISQTVVVTNNPIYASLTPLFNGTNVPVQATLQFSVAANTAGISKIELFGTGGSLGNVTSQSTATFSVPGTNLDIGLHPFYAIVTTTGSKQYRTQTQWVRLGAADSPFILSVAKPPLSVSWPATPGRSYDVLSTTNLTTPFESNTTVVATNALNRWADTNPAVSQRFYRVRTTQ
jgi:hypothetical protein